MDTPPPTPAPTIPQQQVVLPPPKPSGCGCFAGGCVSVLVAIGLIIVVILGGLWFVGGKMLNKFTSTEPTDIAMAAPSSGEYSAAQAKLDQVKNATRNSEATTVSFSAADLNALVARNPDFASQKGRLRFEIAESKMTLAMSVSLRKFPLPGFKNRWFNGSARFGISYEDSNFNFDPDWLEANGHQITGETLRSFASSFNRSFTNSFDEQVAKDGENDTWTKVKSITLQGDQLIVTTFGPPGT